MNDNGRMNSTKWLSEFSVPKMDCPSEERMVRMALEGLDGVQHLTFDLSLRHVRVVHEGSAEPVLAKLDPLGLGATLQSSRPASANDLSDAAQSHAASAVRESRSLRLLLAINGIMFLIELSVGWWAQSAGLIADSLDMFADAAVYGLALYVVGKSVRAKLGAAHVAGWLQLALALGVLIEVVRRFMYGSEPESLLMIGMACIALIANVSCLLLISGTRDSGAHMKASWIFSTNDVIANAGVVVAGILVYFTGSNYPDLAIGGIIGLVVLNGARKILALKG